MLIVITGLDGSGTSSIAEKLHKLDNNSVLLKTPSQEYKESKKFIDNEVRNISQTAHYLYYLSSVKFISDYIKNNIDYKNNNVYCVKYLIDTVVSHRVAGMNVDLDYETWDILKPDLTIFVNVDESIRQERITKRGKSIMDKVLDDDIAREKTLITFRELLKDCIFFNNNGELGDSKLNDFFNKNIRLHN